MPNNKSVGVAYSDPALTSGTTIDGATVTNTTLTSPIITAPTISGLGTTTPQVLAAAGSTQLGGGAITGPLVIVTVTTSAQGVRLPTAATGRAVQVFVPGTVGVKVYPATGARIDAVATNTALALVAGKANIFVARDTTRWVTLRGA